MILTLILAEDLMDTSLADDFCIVENSFVVSEMIHRVSTTLHISGFAKTL